MTFRSAVLLILLIVSAPFTSANNAIDQQRLLEKWQQSSKSESRQKIAGKMVLLVNRGLENVFKRRPRTPSTQKEMMAIANQSVASLEALFGDSDARTIAAIFDAHRIHEKVGRATQSKQLLLRASKLVGEHHRDTLLHAAISTAMSEVFVYQGVQKTQAYFDTAKRIYTAQFGKESLELANLEFKRGATIFEYGSGPLSMEHLTRGRNMFASMSVTDERLVRTSNLVANSVSYIVDERFTESESLYADVNRILANAGNGKLRCIKFDSPTTIPIQRLTPETCDAGLSEREREHLFYVLALVYAVQVDEDLGRWKKLYDRHFDGFGPNEADLLKYQAEGRYEKAIELSKEIGGWLIAQNGSEHPYVGELLLQQATLYRWTGQSERAAELDAMALTILLRHAPSETDFIAQALLQLGVYAAQTGDFEMAQRYFTDTQNVLKDSGRMDSISSVNSSTSSLQLSGMTQGAVSRADIANLNYLMGNFEEAQRILTDVYEAQIQLSGKDNMATVTAAVHLADFYASLNDNQRAAEIVKETVGRMPAEIRGLGTTTTQIVYARWHAYEGEYVPAAETLLKQIEHVRQRGVADTHIDYAALYQELIAVYRASDNHTAAIPYLQMLLEHPYATGNLQKTALIRVQLGEALLFTGKIKEAIAELESSLLDLTVYGNNMTLWNAEAMLSEAMYREGNLEAAIYYGKLSVNRLQELRAGLKSFTQPIQAAFVGDKEHAYRTLADALIEKGDLPQAQNVMAMLKQHEYENYLNRSDNREVELKLVELSNLEVSTTRDYADYSRRLIELNRNVRELTSRSRSGTLSKAEQKQLKSLRKEVAGARREFSQEIADIRKEFASLSQDRIEELGAKHLDSLGSLQGSVRRLGDNVALVHYLVLPDKVRAIVTTGTIQTSLVSEVSEKTINQTIFEWREAISNIEDDINLTGEELYKYLFAPLEPTLQEAGIEVVMVSLDGVLRYLPFSALYDGEAYLGARYRFALFTPAARSAIERQPQEDWQVAAFGVSEAMQSFSALPSVPTELNEIVIEAEGEAGILPGVIALNENFTNDRLSELLQGLDGENYPVIHLASHFAFRPGRESESFLLTGSGGLSIDEIQYGDYPLYDVDLLTLSACNSGLSGIDANGAEIEGLATLAQNKGAAAVLATLWPVADDSTGAFMSEFYRIRAAESLTKAEALQATQRLFTSSDYDSGVFSHPYFWAPFILMGNWL